MDNFLGRYYIPRQKSWSKKRKKLDTPSRQKYAHLLSTQNATKTLPFHNVRHRRTPHTMMTSALSQHLVGLVMHFFVMSAQNLATLADPISNVYKLGIVGG